MILIFSRKLTWLDIARKHHTDTMKSHCIRDSELSEQLMFLALFSYYGEL